MRRLATTLVLLLIACKGSPPAAKKQALQAGDVAFVGATVVPMDREGTLADQTVVVRGDTIALVAPSASVDTKAATIVDAGRFHERSTSSLASSPTRSTS